MRWRFWTALKAVHPSSFGRSSVVVIGRAAKKTSGLGRCRWRPRQRSLFLALKIVHGGGSYCKGIGLIMDSGGRRGHGFKMFKERFRLDVGKFVCHSTFHGSSQYSGIHLS